MKMIKNYKKEEVINFSQEDINKINEIIKKDVSLLSKFNIMDYSLLLAIERVAPRKDKK